MKVTQGPRSFQRCSSNSSRMSKEDQPAPVVGKIGEGVQGKLVDFSQAGEKLHISLLPTFHWLQE